MFLIKTEKDNKDKVYVVLLLYEKPQFCLILGLFVELHLAGVL